MKIPPRPRIGLVVNYSYLWTTEADGGRKEGVKDRPAAIVLARADLGPAEVAYVVPVTHTPPSASEIPDKIEIPHRIKAHLGMDDKPSWVVVNEMNVFVWPGPDLRPVPKTDPPDCVYGILPASFFNDLKAAVAANFGHVKLVKRGS